MIKPIGNNVLLRLKEKKSKSGLVLATQDETKKNEIIIVELGTDCNKELKKGQSVYLDAGGGIKKITVDNNDYYLCSDNLIMGYEK